MVGFGNNMILIKSQDEVKKKDKDKEKSSKGDGVNAVLTLMKELRDFQDQVESCIDAQAIEDNKKKIQAFNNQITQMYEILLEIAKGGIRRENQEEQVQTDQADQVDTSSVSQQSLNIPKMPTI